MKTGVRDFLRSLAWLDRAYTKQVTWTNVLVVHGSTNTVVATNLVPHVIERTCWTPSATTDNPAAKLTAQEILQRVQRAQQQRPAA